MGIQMVMMSHALSEVLRGTLRMICALYLLAGCTPFKLSSYQECELDQDCLKSFEVCNASKLCQTQGALCRWSTRYDLPLTSVSDESGPVIGVLAEAKAFSVEGSQSSAYLGIHAGLAVVMEATQQTPAQLLICDPDPQQREEVLQTFRDHQVRVVIGAPELIDLEGNAAELGSAERGDEAYISLGLSPLNTGAATSGWLNLRPPITDLERAFESLSSTILDYLIDQEKAFNVILPVALTTLQPDYVQDLIWRMSPYMESIFRTLVVYYQPKLLVDDDIRTFLSTPRPLRLLISYAAPTQDELSALTTTAANQSISPSAQGPLMLYAAAWDVNHVATVPRGYWSDIIKMSVIYGQYQKLTSEDERPSEMKSAHSVQEDAFSVATQLGGGSPLGSAYFGLAYDAGVIAGLVSRVADEMSPRQALDRLISSVDPTRTPLYFSKRELAKVGSSVDSLFTDRPLSGMSGLIKDHQGQDTAELPLMFVCSKEAQTPLLFPIERLAMPEQSSDGISQRFRISEETLRRCERQ